MVLGLLEIHHGYVHRDGQKKYDYQMVREIMILK